ncbi:uncharacterized protein ACBR49_018068 [Aulostomus maculatus]
MAVPRVWLCLLFGVPVAQGSQVVVQCPEPVQLSAGKNVTVNCKMLREDCAIINCTWSEMRVQKNLRGSMNHICDSHSPTRVSLTILNVTKNANYSVSIHTDCGFSCTVVEVRILRGPEKFFGQTKMDPMLGLFVAILIVAFLGLLVAYNRRRLVSYTLGRRLMETDNNSCLSEGQ